VSILVDAFGTGKVSNAELTELVNQHFDLRPGAIIEQFKLREMPGLNGGRFYRDTAAYGHFGRPDLKLPWEDVADKAASLLQAEASRLQQGSSL
jgi:S-adenosylmethionine synthetase